MFGNENRETNNKKQALKITVSIMVAVFIVGNVLYSFLNANLSNLQKLNFPVNSQGYTCNIDYANTYPYLFIDLSTQSALYRCVNSCPSGWNQFIITDSTGEQIYGTSSQEVNLQMGGICWSQEKQAAMRRRGLLDQLSFKENIIHQLRSVFIVVVITLLLSSLALPLFYCLPQSINYFLFVATALLLLIATIIYFSIGSYGNQAILIIISVIVVIVFIINVICWTQKLKQSAIYTISSLKIIKEGQFSSFTLKSTLILVIYNIINLIALTIIFSQLIAIISSQTPQKHQNQLFFTIHKTCWKYLLLLIEWFLLSNILKQFYTYTIVKLGYQINNISIDNIVCFTITDTLNIVVFSVLLLILWLPLRIIDFFKPNGAIIRENEEETLCHTITKTAYCCCGFFINKVHRYTFNPYLLLATKQQQNFEAALKKVQQSYHIHDDRYDKSSLWVYRLSNYIIIIIVSLLGIQLMGIKQQQLSQAQLFTFYIVGAILSVQVGRLNINFWSNLVQVREFIVLTTS